MGTSNISSAYSGMMESYDVFTELLDNQDFNESQYDLVAGNWPKEYNELVIILNSNNEISDYTLYSLGLLDQDDLKKQFNNMISGEKVEFENKTFSKEELLKLTYKLVLNTDFYKKTNGVWIDKSNDEK